MSRPSQHTNGRKLEPLNQPQSQKKSLHVIQTGPVILLTALIEVQSRFGSTKTLRALIDGGS